MQQVDVSSRECNPPVHFAAASSTCPSVDDEIVAIFHKIDLDLKPGETPAFSNYQGRITAINDAKESSKDAYFAFATGCLEEKLYYFALLHFQKAWNLGCEAAENYLKDPELYFESGEFLRQMQMYPEAFGYFEKTVVLLPTHTKALYLIAEMLFNGSHVEANRPRALTCFKEVVKYDDQNAFAHVRIAVMSEDPCEAEIHARRALDLEPEDGYILSVMGRILRKKGAHNKAKGFFERAVQFDSTLRSVHTFLGGYALEENKFVDAQVHYEKALQLKPDDSYAIGKYGIALFRQKNYAEALRQFERGAQLAPNDLFFVVKQGRVHECMGNITKAQEFYRQTLQKKPDHVDAKNGLERIRKISLSRPAL